MRQSIVNILSNAIRHAKTEIYANVSCDEESVYITISDNGNGIEKEDLPHIFEKFYKGKNGNCGLGLPIAKASVEMMKGEITATNNEIGAEFMLKFNKFN